MIEKNKKDKREQDTEELREEILDSALVLFARKGYFNTSIEDIKKASEVSTSKIYRQFKNKQAIALALQDDLSKRMNDSIREISRTNQSARDRIYALIDLLFSLTEQAPDVMRFLLDTYHHEINPENEVDTASPFNNITAMIEGGIESGEIRRVDSNLISGCMLGMVVRTIQLRLDGTLDKPLERYLHDFWNIAWNAIEAS